MTTLNLFFQNFHFIRPFWFLAIFALLLVLWLLKKHRFYQSPWQKFLPEHLSQVLVEGDHSAKAKSITSNKNLNGQTFLIKPFLIGLLSIIALAGPAWQKLPQPVYQTERGSVLIMDMSYSMYSTDVKPNRLTRSRFKAVDLLKKINEGDTGLVAYAGDAFVISPLTQDIKNIELLLPSLTPEIMPTPGANPLAALTLAHEMLLNAGHLTGDIYWFTDDVDNEELTDLYDWSNKFGHQLNILGVGTNSGAPITLPNGELLKDNGGAIVIPRLPSQKLKSLAARGHGNYQTISNDDSDINKLISQDKLLDKDENTRQESQQSGDQWQEQGAWLLLLVLPLILGYFRRGSAILMLPFASLPLLFLLSLSSISSTAVADENANISETNQTSEPQASALASTWQNLWQTNDQQGQQQFNKQNYQEAAQLFENPQWQGSAHYKAGDYQAALDAYRKGEQANSASSLYNQGNALAQMQEFDQAIASYEEALKIDPDLQDAKENIEKIKQKQKQKEQEQQQGDQSQDSESKDQQSEDSQSQNKNDKENEQQSQDQQQSDNENKEKSDSSNESQENDQQQNKPEDSNEEQANKDAEQKQKEQQEKEAAQAKQNEKENQQDEKKTAAQIAEEQQAKETEQKHLQLLNKVTDDPYLLLRNKMQIEYQKRKQNGASQGVKKKW